jgi:hypothetical protein
MTQTETELLRIVHKLIELLYRHGPTGTILNDELGEMLVSIRMKYDPAAFLE